MTIYKIPSLKSRGVRTITEILSFYPFFKTQTQLKILKKAETRKLSFFETESKQTAYGKNYHLRAWFQTSGRLQICVLVVYGSEGFVYNQIYLRPLLSGGWGCCWRLPLLSHNQAPFLNPWVTILVSVCLSLDSDIIAIMNTNPLVVDALITLSKQFE